MSNIILVIGGHPDDYESSAGIAILKKKEQGNKVIAVVCSNGEATAPINTRKKETENAAEILGIDDIYFLGYKDTRFPEIGKIVSDLEEINNKVKPYCVITHSEIDSHQDHVYIAQASKAAFRNVRKVLLYRGWSALKDFSPDIFIEGPQEQLEKKIEAILAHKSQASRVNEEIIRSTAIFYGSLVDGHKHVLRYAEPFIVNHYTL